MFGYNAFVNAFIMYLSHMYLLLSIYLHAGSKKSVVNTIDIKS